MRTGLLCIGLLISDMIEFWKQKIGILFDWYVVITSLKKCCEKKIRISYIKSKHGAVLLF